MREIKFRAYSITQGMIYFTMEDLILNRKNFQHLIDYPQLPKMEYTGLKDKNGKEIYESDIVELLKYDDSFMGGCSKVRREVKWDTYYGASWNFGISHKDGEKRFSYPFPDDVEIIGNIHENPDLLKGDKS